MTDEDGLSTTSADRTITVTVTGTNDVPTISAASTATGIDEAGSTPGLAIVSGELSGVAGANWTDLDTTEDAGLAITLGSFDAAPQAALSFTNALPSGGIANYAVITGTYGSLYLQADGSYTYVLDNMDADTQALDDLSSVTEVFHYTIADAQNATATQTLTISVTGTSDAPVIAGGPQTGGVYTARTLAYVVEAGTNPAVAHGFETTVNQDDLIGAALGADPTAVASVLAAVLADLPAGATQADAIAQVWDYLDDGYVAGNNYYNVALNQAFAYLGLAYAEYLADGGQPLTDITVKYQPDGAFYTPDGQPDRLQSLHDNLLGNLNVVGLADRFGAGSPIHTAILDAMEDAGVLNLLNRPVFSGEQTSNAALTAAFDVANGYLPAASGVFTATDAEGDTLTWSVTGPDTYGTMAIDAATGAWAYTLAAGDADTLALGLGVSATQVFTATVSDGNGGTASQTITITVTGTNDVPVITTAMGGNAGTVEEAGTDVAGTATASGTLTATDVDTGETATLVWSTPDTSDYGTFTLAANGGWTFTLDQELADSLSATAVITETFTATVTDVHGATATQVITLTINGTNDAPVITGTATGAITEPAGNPGAAITPLSGSLAFSDVDTTDRPVVTGVTLAVSDLTEAQLAAANGLLAAFAATVASGGTNTGAINWSFSPAAGALNFLREAQTTTLTFTITLNDGNGGTDTQDVTITLTGTNDPVTLLPGGVEDGAVTELAEGATGSPLTETGTFQFSDEDLAANVVQVLGAGGVVNGAGSLGGTLTQMTVQDMTNPAVRTVTWSYSIDDALLNGMAQGESATETFTIRVLDQATGGVLLQPITITVTGTNDRPVITNVDVSGALTEDATVTLADNGSISFADADTTDLSTVVAELSSSSGDVTLTSGQLATFAAAFSLGGNTSGANDGTVTWAFSTASTNVDFLAAGETLVLTYTVTVTDDSATATDTATTTVTITLTGTNDVPTLAAETGAVVDTAGNDTYADLTGTLDGADLDASDSLTYGLATGQATTGSYGSLTVNTNGTYSYVVNAAAVNALPAGPVTDVFNVQVTDSAGVTTVSTLTVNVTGANDMPDALNGNASGTEDAGVITIDVASLISDRDTGDVLTIVPTVDAAQGTVSVSGTEITFTPAANFFGLAIISYTVTDAGGLTDTATIRVTVAPVADVDTITTNATLDPSALKPGTTDIILGSGIQGTGFIVAEDNADAPGVELGLSTIMRLQGTAPLDAADATGRTFVVPAGAAAGTINETASPSDDGYARWNINLSIATDTDNNGGTLGDLDYRFSISKEGAGGFAEVFHFTLAEVAAAYDTAFGPGAGAAFLAGEVFQQSLNLEFMSVLGATFDPTAPGHYQVSVVASTHGGAELVRDTMFVRVNSAPVGVDDVNGADVVVEAGVTAGDASAIGNVLTNDTDPDLYPVADADELVVSDVSFGSTSVAAGTAIAGTYGSLTLAADGNWTYTLNDSNPATAGLSQGEVVTEAFTYTVTDPDGASDTATLTVTITGTNDAPVIAGGPQTGGVYTARTLAYVTEAGTNPAVAHGFETTINQDDLIGAALGADPTAVASVLAAVLADLPAGATQADAIAQVWDYLDDGYVAGNNYYNVALNQAFAYLGLAYAEYLADGGQPLTDITVKYQPDGAFYTPDGQPDRLQSLHDNLLGNLNVVGLADRFGAGSPIHTAILDAMEDAGVLNLLNRPVFSGEQTSNAALTAAFDVANGYLPAASGVFTATDAEGDTLTWSVTGPDTYGTMAIDAATGAWAYTLAAGDADTLALGLGVSATQVFTATVSDGNGGTASQTITITVTGTNDVPVITTAMGGNAGTVEEGGERVGGTVAGTATASGTLTATDVDAGETATLVWSTPNTSAYGTFVLAASGAWTFTLDPALANSLTEAAVITETFTATVTDAHGATATQVITLTINGTNDAPVITSNAAAALGTVTESSTGGAPTTPATTVTGTLTATDVDTGDTPEWTGSGNGIYGTLAITTAGVWTYTLDDARAATQALATGSNGTDSFTVTVTDDAGVTRTQTITISVTGADEVFTVIGSADGTITGTSNDDSITGNTGDDTLSGGSGNDEIYGGAGDDLISGGSHDDLLVGGAGSDTISGGSDIDTVVMSGAWTDYTIALNTGTYTLLNRTTGQTESGDIDSLTGVEFIRFGAGSPVAIATVLNDAPVAVADTGLTVAEDGSVVIVAATLAANDTDADSSLGDTLTVTAVGSPLGGTVSLVGGNVTFTPNANFNGPASFTYTVTDAHGLTSVGTVSLTVTAVNDAPTGSATAVLAAGTEDTGYTVSAADLLAGFSDVDSVLSVTGLTASNGTAVQNMDGSWTITPTANFNGPVTLSYTVTDGALTVAGTQSYTVNAVNDAPTGSATAVLAAGTEDTGYTVSAADLLAGFSDVDSVLSVTGLTASNGTAVQNMDGSWTITPTANFNGPVTLSYTVTDGTLSVAGSQSYTVNAVNDAPTGSATAVLAAGTEDTGYTVSAADLLAGFSDVDSVLSVTGLTASNGTAVQNMDGSWTITPTANFNGPVTLSYTVTDGALTVAGTQSYTVNAVNDAPTGSATAVLAAGTEDTGYTVSAADLLAGFSDVDSVLSVTGLTASNGTAVQNMDGSWTITPTANFNGPVTLSYTVTDGALTVAGTQSYTVNAVNDAPTGSATAVLAAGTEDTGYTVSAADLLAGFSDVDSVLSVTGLTASNGTAVQNMDGSWTITPTANFNGPVTLSYTVTDGTLSVAGSQSYTVNAVNDAPTGSATAVLAAGTEDTGYTVSAADLLAGFSDVDSVLSVTGLTASNGTAVQNMDGSWTITPTANFNGPVTLSYTVTDGALTVAGTQSYTVNAVNDAPTGSATAVLAAGTEDTGYTVSAADLLAGFSDVDSVLSVTGLTASNGTAVQNMDGSWTITPTANFNGPVTLSYTVTDGTLSVAGSQSYTVNAVNDAPTGSATAVLAAGTEDTGYTVSAADLLAGFSDVDSVLSVTGLTASNGTAVQNMDGSWTITPTANFNGPVTLSYTVTDGALTVAGTQCYTVNAVNDAPTGSATAVLAAGTEDTGYTVSAADLLAGFSDVDSVLSVTGLTASNGTAVQNMDGSWTITPTANFNGPVTLSYTVTDGALTVAGTQSYTVNAVNDAPTGIVLGRSTLAEVVGNGHLIGRFTSVDADAGDTSTFTLLDSAGGRFVIVGNQLQVADRTLIDFEVASSHQVTVRVTDSSGLSVDQTFTITVTDVVGEQRSGTNGNDVIIGATGNDTLRGLEGNDVLIGGADNDSLIGAGGDDTLNGGTGGDAMNGGAGFDLVSYEDSTRGIRASLQDVTFNRGEAVGDTFTALEGIVGSDFADVLVGNGANNLLVGGEGADRLLGLGGDDTLTGGLGSDTMIGATGADVFAYATAAEGDDHINAFDATDSFQFAAGAFGLSGHSGVLDAANFRSGTTNAAVDGDDLFIFRTTDDTLWFDADGNGAGTAVLIADLSNNYNLTNSQIVIVPDAIIG